MKNMGNSIKINSLVRHHGLKINPKDIANFNKDKEKKISNP